jgi:hypothetical protein
MKALKSTQYHDQVDEEKTCQFGSAQWFWPSIFA